MYYSRFGFRAETAAFFASPYAEPYFQVLLSDDFLCCQNRAGPTMLLLLRHSRVHELQQFWTPVSLYDLG